MRTSGIRLLLIAALIAAACGREPDTAGDAAPQQPTPAFGPVAQAQLDSGNAAYQMGEYERALTYYEGAIHADSANAPAWFGVFMAHNALGNSEEAHAAMQRAQQLAPAAELDAEAHPADPSSRGALPADHPPLRSDTMP